jgi:hypothetical protein
LKLKLNTLDKSEQKDEKEPIAVKNKNQTERINNPRHRLNDGNIIFVKRSFSTDA